MLPPIDPPEAALAELVSLSAAMAAEGAPLIERVLGVSPEPFTQWSHYPTGDAIDPESGARWYYHAHPPEQREPGEHGHFHLFLPLACFAGEAPLAVPAKLDGAKVVHVAALAFDTDGLPTHWFATNQWVTEEHLHAAPAIIARLSLLNLARAGESAGIAHVGRWLTLALIAAHADIVRLLRLRDQSLAHKGPRDRDAEILARLPFAL